MSGLQGDYMPDNVLARMRRIERRLDALERRGRSGNDTGPTEGATGAAPADALPSADSIRPLYLIERTTGDLYQLICEIKGGRARLLLQRVGPLRNEGG